MSSSLISDVTPVSCTISSMSDDDFDTLMSVLDAVETEGFELTEEEYDAVMAEENTELYGRIYNVLTTAYVNFLTTVSVLDGKVSVTDSANSNKVSGGTVTITAKGSLFSKKTNNITISNNTDSQAQLSFDYSADKASSFTIAGANAAASGSYSIMLAAGGMALMLCTSMLKSGRKNKTKI